MAINTYKKDENQIEGKKTDILKRVLKYYASYKGRIALVIAMVVVCSLIVIAIPKFTQHAIDVDVSNGDIRGLIITCSIAAGLAVLMWILMVIREHMLSDITNEIVYNVRRDAFDHLQTLSLFYFDSRPTGKILSRLISDVSSLKEMLTKLVTNLVPNVVLLVGVVTVMFISNPKLTLSVIVVIPLLVIAVYFVMIRGFKNWESYRAKTSNMNAYTHESYTGIKVIQAFGAEAESIEEGTRIMNDVEKAWGKAVRRADLLNIVVEWSKGIGYLFLYLSAVVWLKMGKGSVGELVAFGTYLSLFWQPIRSLASMFNQLTNQLTGAGRVFELLDTESILQEAPDATELNVTDGNVLFDNIDFAYPDEPERLILKGLSFKVKKGESIALVGPTGAGKTTIVNLLCRFYDPIGGRVLIDGNDISHATLKSLRSNIGVMTQDSFLFSGTVRENLLYGRPDATDEQMMDACKRLSIEGFILDLPQGYDTPVNQDSLSQGQKQLIALARTLIADPKILLLDEATSAIDTATEKLVQAGMAILMKDRTSFVVAHRLSTIVNSDRIFVIQDGGIAEQGNHKELLKANGLYANLYKAQFQEV